MKQIVIISPYDEDGKTAMVETLVGHPLQWYDSKITCEYLTGPIMCADVEYGGMQFRIFEVSAFNEDLNLDDKFYGKEDPDPIVAPLTDLLKNANLVIEVHDSTKKLVLTTLNDFLEQKVDGKTFDTSIIYPKKIVVMTKKDLPNEVITWFYNLTEKEKRGIRKKGGR